MKWLSIVFVTLISMLPAQAATKYTKAECILLKQQVDIYERRLGVYSRLYTDSKKSLEANCGKYQDELSKLAEKTQQPSKKHKT